MIVPSLSPLSLVAMAIIVAALGAALSRRFLATGSLMVANIAIFLLMLLGPAATLLNTPEGQVPLGPLGSFPVVQSDLALWVPNLLALEPLGFVQLFTSMFVHADLFHILGNMIFLWAFGMPFEERIGHRRFVAIYLASGLVGSLAQAWAGVAMQENVHMLLGASGAIFGIMCAFAAKFPNQVIGVPVPLLFFFFRIPMRVLYGALLWVAYNLLYVLVLVRDPTAPTGNVGYFAHLGGGLAGALLAVLMLRHVAGVPGKGNHVAIDLGALGEFAQDNPTRDVLAHMRQNHDEPEVFQAWLDRFFRTAACPTCKHRVMPKHRGEVVCTQGHSFDVRQDKRQKLGPGAPTPP